MARTKVMKVTELIKKLEEMYIKYGDLPVTGEGGGPAKVEYVGECPDCDNPEIVYPATISVC
jgi:hypothetical protein